MMLKRCRFTDDELNDIYDRTKGRCHVCHRTLSFANYGASGTRGAWHVEHSRPLANGGTRHLNNLYSACISCNLVKGTVSSRTARRWAGTSRAPLSMRTREAVIERNTITGAATFGVLGALVAGPRGLLFGALFGAVAGYTQDPEG